MNFFIDDHPDGFDEYWDLRGVNAGATDGTWQAHMYKIITGDEPMFYLDVAAGPSYMLVDGLLYYLDPLNPVNLRVNGDYHLGDYTFAGVVTDTSGQDGLATVSMTFKPPPPGLVGTPVLASTSGDDLTTDDLTCSYTLGSTATTAATAWYVDGVPQMTLYMPMEGGAANALLDYSGNGIGVTTGGDPMWISDGGHDGNGAFAFDGIGDRLIAGETFPTSSSYTKTAWVYRTGTTNNNIISGDNGGTGHAFWAQNNGGTTLSAGHHGSWAIVIDSQPLDLDTWYFVAVTFDYDSGEMILYRDAIPVDSATVPSGQRNVTDATLLIGSFGSGNNWSGNIDEPRVYDHVLSPQQIAAMYNGGSGDINEIVSQQTDVGEDWQCRVTPFSASDEGATAASNTLTILSPPDEDGDGIPDSIEVGHSCLLYDNDDTDADGIDDGVEDANQDGIVDPGETDPCDDDSDDDGIPDGIEDANGNGAVDAGETDPLDDDTDGDGLLDGEEDTNFNGVVDPGENDPRAYAACPLDMVANYKMDNPSAYADYLGGPTATCSNCPTQATGRAGEALQFDGIDDEVNIPDNDQFDWAADASFSIEYWMKTGESTAGNRVIVGRDGGPTALHWWVGCDGGGKAAFQLQGTNGAGEYIGGNGPVLNDDAWHHLVFVRDESIDTNLIYVDGNEVHSGVYDYAVGFAESVPVNVGHIDLGGRYRYNGIVDELAFYDRALSAAEIQQHYDNGMADLGSCDAGPVFTSLTLETSVDKTADKADWSDVVGSLAAGFTMELAPAVDYHYLDVSNDPGATTTDRPLASGDYGFYLAANPAGYLAYWADRGVDENSPDGSWQAHMYDIIIGDEPMFYLKVDSTPPYMLVDGLQRDYLPIGIEDFLRVNGGYPLGAYQFAGTVFDDFGNGSGITVDMTFEQGPVPDVDGNGVVDGYDLYQFVMAYNTAAPDCDFNMDGIVNADDLGTFAGEFGYAP